MTTEKGPVARVYWKLRLRNGKSRHCIRGMERGRRIAYCRRALQINGYESWDTTKRSCRANVYAMLLMETPTGGVVAGHNVGFDIAMIDAECDRLGYRRFSEIVSHRKLDTQALALADVVAGVLPSAALGAIVQRWPALSGGPLHDALSDARTSLNIARHYVRRLWATEGIHAPITEAP